MAEGIAVAEKIKLNLMSGTKPFPDFINVDMYDIKTTKGDTYKPDIAADVRSLPFSDDYADEVWCIHGIEHFYTWEMMKLIHEWKRVLKPGGLMVIETPDMEKVLDAWSSNKSLGMAKTWAALYGDQSIHDPAMVHKWCFSFYQLKALLEDCGMREVVKKRAQYHMEIRDMRVEAIK